MNTHMKSIVRIVLTATIMIGLLSFSAFAADPDLSKIDALGNNILHVVNKIGFWVILVKCLMDVISSVMQGDVNKFGKTIIIYVCLYGSLYFVPWAMRLVEGVF